MAAIQFGDLSTNLLGVFMREIVLDTETTGLDVSKGHKIIEIGALEIINLVPTGKTLHLYINPERDIDPDAIKIHGITNEFVSNKPLFKNVASEFLDFIRDDKLVIHNAAFDMGFLNFELRNSGFLPIPTENVIDTLKIARQKFPGAQASLDALCRRFQIDNHHRDLHGALIDADLLASVYVELKGGLQPTLLSDDAATKSRNIINNNSNIDSDFLFVSKKQRPTRPHHISKDELDKHLKFLKLITDPIWLQSD